MKCTNCQGEWIPPANQSLGKCPFCQADILQMLNEQAEMLSTEVILANMLQAYSTDLLQNQQRLTAMISDLFAHDHKTKRLLLLSVRENIPNQLLSIQQKDTAEQNTHILALQHRLAEDAFLKEEVAEQIVEVWTNALCWKNEEFFDSFEILWDNGYYGFRNSNGKMITPFKYDNVHNFLDGQAKVSFQNKWGLINVYGCEITEIKYDKIGDFNDGLALVMINGRYGYINKKGKVIIPLKYYWAEPFNDGLASVNIIEKKWCFIDKEGQEVMNIDFDVDYASSFYNEFSLVRTNNFFCNVLIDKNCTIVHLIDYKWGGMRLLNGSIRSIRRFNNGTFKIENHNNTSGLLDKFGNVIISFYYGYDCIFDFSEGLAPIRKGNKWGFCNEMGELVISLKYDYVSDFHDGLAWVQIDNKYGYIDNKGNVRIPIIYDMGYNKFQEGLAPVNINNKWGYIDHFGKLIIEMIYDEAEHFAEGLACVKLNGRYGFINKMGREIIPIQFLMSDKYFHNGIVKVFIAKLERAFVNKEGIIKVKRNSEWFTVENIENQTTNIM